VLGNSPSGARVAPLGAFFADDLSAAAEQAARSALVTHTHDEAVAGAIAVAVTAAQAHRLCPEGMRPGRREFLDLVLPLIPESEVKSKVRRARDMGSDASVQFAVSVLGNGTRVSAQDTVPLSLWCAGEHLDDYGEALWLMVSALGDRDTTCAIVGGIVATYTGHEAIPSEWSRSREPLPSWPFEETFNP
jgi:ADP-ribosylglycohydrolase